MAAQLKSKTQTDSFNLAMQDWLSGDVSGHLSPFMYTEDSNDSRWKNGHSSETYYVARDEKATFDKAINDLDILVENFVDLGPGGEDSVAAKSMKIAEKTLTANYLPLDLSPVLARSAAQIMTQKLGIKSSPIIADFFEKLPLTLPNTLISLLGLTFANLETYDNAAKLQQRLVQVMHNYRQAVTGSSFFLVSFDANTNADEIVACYNNEEFGSLVRSCVERAIDTSELDYHVKWTPENYQLATGMRSKRDQFIYLDDVEFALEQDEFLPVLNSYRFPVPFVVEAAQQSGWEQLKTWSATGRVHYVLFKAI